MDEQLMKRLLEAEETLKELTAAIQGSTRFLELAHENAAYYMTRCQSLEDELSETKVCLGYAVACLYRAGLDDEQIQNAIREISQKQKKEVQ